jgi:hypothetical protein
MPEKERFKTNLEPEEIMEEFNPLDEPVNEKSYTSPNINIDGVDMSKPIDEPRFSPPPINKKPITSDEPPPKKEAFNPEMKYASRKETKQASAFLAKLCVDGYDRLHIMVNQSMKVSEKKLDKWQSEGEMNLNAMISYDYGKTMRAGEFFKHYNDQMENFISVSQEFKDEVTPLLEEIFAERGMGMTKEQRLLSLVVTDAFGKGILIFQQKQILNSMIQNIKAATTNMYVPPTPAPAPAPAPTSAPAPPTPEPTPDTQYQEPEEKQNSVSTRVKAGRPRKSI